MECGVPDVRLQRAGYGDQKGGPLKNVEPPKLIPGFV
jgi:hypothetical protein